MKRMLPLLALILLFAAYSHQQSRVIDICGAPGTGRSRSIAGTNPAAGVEISETVPAGVRWRISAVRFTLLTDSTAANRTLFLVFDDGADPSFITMMTQAAQPASTSRVYHFFLDMPAAEVVAGGNAYLPLPDELWLPAGFRMRTLTTSFQAGDDYTAPEFLIEECTP